MSAKPTATFFWKRLDRPGLDCCRLFRTEGWRLSGVAVFMDPVPCALRYDVQTDENWVTRRATVMGHVGDREIDLSIRSTAKSRWRLNGAPQPRLESCIDLDLAFTPATNLIALRRLGLRVGQRGESHAAYLEFPRMTLTTLPQIYRRVSRAEYAYESPTAGYTGRLRVGRLREIERYPGLFERVTGTKRR